MAIALQDVLFMRNVALCSVRSIWDLINLPYDWDDPNMKDVKRAIAKSHWLD